MDAFFKIVLYVHFSQIYIEKYIDIKIYKYIDILNN